MSYSQVHDKINGDNKKGILFLTQSINTKNEVEKKIAELESLLQKAKAERNTIQSDIQHACEVLKLYPPINIASILKNRIYSIDMEYLPTIGKIDYTID